jgi:multiple sugar transport system substrate-binding protein
MLYEVCEIIEIFSKILKKGGKMKKILLIITVFTFALILSSCGGDPDVQKIQLSYADWGDKEFNQQMIDAFEEKYPYIKVSLRSDIEGSGIQFTENLSAAAKVGMLPDVFATDNVPSVINEGLTLDVKTYWDADEDTKLVYPNIADTAIYNGKRLAIPSFQFFKGIAINKTLFKREKLTTVQGKYRVDSNGLPVKDWTYSEMVAITEAIKNRDLSNPQEFVLGMEPWYGVMDFNQVWPTLDKADMKYDTWDGEKFNYTSPEWISAMTEKVRVHQLNNGTIDDILESEYIDQDGNLIPNMGFLQGWKLTTGYTAMGIHGTWNLKTLVSDTKLLDIDMGFWPYPGGAAGQYPPVIIDFQCVSSQTANPKEAYMLAKWMTYGREGWNARMDIFTENYEAALAEDKPLPALTAFPTANYEEVWVKINPYIKDIDGLTEIIGNLDKSKPDIDKWIPGYRDFWNWVYSEDNNNSWAKLVIDGTAAVPQYAAIWNDKINLLVKEQMESLGKK